MGLELTRPPIIEAALLYDSLNLDQIFNGDNGAKFFFE
jgi:hypothetical protein